MGHRAYHVFEELNNHVRLTVDHAARVTPDGLATARAFRCENQLGVNRLFLVGTGSAVPSTVTDLARGEVVELATDTLVFMPADRRYAFCFEPGLEMVAFHFRLELPGGLELFQDQERLRRRDGGWRARGLALAEMLESPQAAAMLSLRAAVLDLAATFLDMDLASLRDWTRRMATYAPLQELLASRCDATLKVTDAAAAMGMTADSLSRQFKRDTGGSLKQYLAAELQRRAVAQLLYTDRSIKQIAHDLAFSSAFYFSRFFKRHAGLSPQAYREQNLGYGAP